MKRLLLLGRKALTNLDSVLKSRDITLPTKVHIVKAMVFCGSHAWMWDFFLDSKITVDGDCSYKIRNQLLLSRKAITNLDCVLESKDTTLPTKVCIVKAMVFPVVMYGCESWTIKLSAIELMLLNCGVGEDSWESLELQGGQTSQS